jgi:hypothetical protein
MSHDQKCYDLAEYFLPDGKKEKLEQLAEEIQNAIENFLEDTGPHNHICQQCETVMAVECECDKPLRMDWCSSRCREAFDL